MELVGRQEAITQGLKRYFTGQPCKRGHVAERRTSNNHCVVCKSYSDRPSQIKTRIRTNNQRKRRSRVTAVQELKANSSCVRCGFAHPAALQFHHLGDKTAGISKMSRSSSSLAAVMDEIKKCVILCANCHAIEHWNERRGGLDG